MNDEKQDEMLESLIDSCNNSGSGISIPTNLTDDEFIEFIKELE